MWRSLSPTERQGYFDVAIEFLNEERPPRSRKRRRSPSRGNPAVPNDDELLPLDPPPEFAIVPRGSSGAGAARASEQCISHSGV
jgi:hypothetical protein